MGQLHRFYRRTSQILLMSFAFFLVSDIALIGYCEVTEGSLSVFFCNHDDVPDEQHHSGAMGHTEHGDQMDPQMDPHQKGMDDPSTLTGYPVKRSVI